MNIFLNTCLIVSLVSWTGLDLYSETLDYFQLTENQSRNEWLLRTIRDITISLFISVSIIWSIWSYSSASNNRKAKWAVILSIGFGILVSALTCFKHQEYEEVVDLNLYNTPFPQEKINSLQEYLDSPKFDIQEKSNNSHRFASLVFKNNGQRIQIMNMKGEKVLYKPTAKEYEFRKNVSMLLVQQQHTLTSLKTAWIATSSLVLFSIAIGGISIRIRSFYKKSTK